MVEVFVSMGHPVPVVRTSGFYVVTKKKKKNLDFISTCQNYLIEIRLDYNKLTLQALVINTHISSANKTKQNNF